MELPHFGRADARLLIEKLKVETMLGEGPRNPDRIRSMRIKIKLVRRGSKLTSVGTLETKVGQSVIHETRPWEKKRG